MKSTELKRRRKAAAERGFSLIETSIALVIMMVAGLGVVSLFVYSIGYNSGGTDRAIAISVAQQQIEQLRSVLTGSNNDMNGNATLKTITIRVDPMTSGWGAFPVIVRTARSTTTKGAH